MHSTKSGKQLEALISTVRESEVTTTQDLLSWIQNHPGKKPEFMHKLYSPGQFNQLMSKALEWVASERDKALVWSKEIYTVSRSNHPKGQQWMTLNKSTECLDEWFRWQNIDTKVFIQSVEEIMEKKINKVNTLLLLGTSNGGKTLVARSLCDTFKSVGVCLQGINYSFFLESCINTRVIHHDECVIVPQVMKTYKRLMEGADTPVNRKNKTSQMMKRTPIHCICHRLALACIDTVKAVESIGKVALNLSQLWKFFDNSPKCTAASLKVQFNVIKGSNDI